MPSYPSSDLTLAAARADRAASGSPRFVRLSDLDRRGVSRGRRRANVAAGRWRALNGRGVDLARGPLTEEEAWQRMLLSVGPQARLGGMTALRAVGLNGFAEEHCHVWVPKSRQKARVTGVCLHETRLWGAADATSSGIPRSLPAAATVQGALWALTPRQALLCLVMPIQQRLTRVEDVAAALERIRRHRFRAMLRMALSDIAGGAQSLGELDFARMCGERGLPAPTRQARRRSSQGVVYLDVYWAAYRVALEINGAGHARLEQSLRDEVRALDLQVDGDATVSVSVLTLRCDPEPFFAGLARLLRSRGWPG